MKKEIKKEDLMKIAYIIISIILTIPSVIYLIKYKTIYHFTGVFKYLFIPLGLQKENLVNAIIYISIFFGLFTIYFYLLKNSHKVFKNNKTMTVFIVTIGILFAIVIPTTSLDVYSYIGNGWVDSHYNENPYYTSVQDVVDQNGYDTMLGKVARCWRDEPVVYGPAWSFICKIITGISFGNIDVALFLFKAFSLAIFLASTWLIYKITKKKFWVLAFALNPFVLFESLTNVHNDIFLVFFILLSLYMLIKKKNIHLSIICIAIATAIKYLSILIVPFLVIYALKNNQIKEKIKKTIIYALEFIFVIIAFYLIYIKDINVLSGIFVQQNKYGRSIFLGLWYLLGKDSQVLQIVKIVTLSIFATLYIAVILRLFMCKDEKNIKLNVLLKKYNIFLVIFTFILITNFNSWYLLWLFPTIMWQKARNIKLILYITLSSTIAHSITYATGIDNETMGIPYLAIMIGLPTILYIADTVIKRKTQMMERKKNANNI